MWLLSVFCSVVINLNSAAFKWLSSAVCYSRHCSLMSFILCLLHCFIALCFLNEFELAASVERLILLGSCVYVYAKGLLFFSYGRQERISTPEQ